MRWKGCLVAITSLLLSTFSIAQNSVTVGIPTAEFNFVSSAQLHTEWCWAASVQMVLNWYNIPVKQTDVVDRIYGKPVDEAATEDAIRVALSGTAYDRQGKKVHLHAERRLGAPPVSLLIEQLGEQRPILVTVHSTKTMLHAVVLTSAEYVNSGKDTRVTSLTFRDPNPEFHDRHTAATVSLKGEKLARFAKTISSYYVVSVKE